MNEEEFTLLIGSIQLLKDNGSCSMNEYLMCTSCPYRTACAVDSTDIHGSVFLDSVTAYIEKAMANLSAEDQVRLYKVLI